MQRSFASLASAALLLTTCVRDRGQPDPLVGAPNDYLGAAVFAGSAVGASVAHRKLWGGCYAHCTPGYRCNEASGFCEPLDCRCARGETCVRQGARVTCTAATGAPLRANPGTGLPSAR